VAVSDSSREVLVAECKWSKQKVGTSVLRVLSDRSDMVCEALGARRVHFALFSRAGFTPSLCREAKRENVLLVKPQQMVEGSS
jgi:hypothetical protein